jgi:hypothetical protein
MTRKIQNQKRERPVEGEKRDVWLRGGEGMHAWGFFLLEVRESILLKDI